MDRLNQLRAGGEEGRSGDATLDSSSPPSEAYMSANDTSSKYFSLSDSTFDISPIKDVSLASAASASEADHTLTDPDELLSNLSPITKKDVMLDSFKIGKHIEAANILSGGVDIFDDNENSFDGDELVIDDNVDLDDKTNIDDKSVLEEAVSEGTLVETHVDVASKDTEVVLQIDGKNVDAIDIGNGLYLYRKAGQEELAAVQIITEDTQQEPSFKFLKVRENVEGNLEVYEEFEIEVSKDLPMNEAKPSAKKTPNVPIKNINKVKSESSTNKVVEKKDRKPKEVSTSKVEVESEAAELESKTELNLNGKMMKFNESRKSPVVGTFTPMTYSSTPNKEGKPLTKTMVDQQLHPNRHSDNVKKTIEVHTDSQTKKLADEINKQKPESLMKKKVSDDITTKETSTGNKTIEESIQHTENQEKKALRKDNVSTTSDARVTVNEELQNVATASTEDPSKMKLLTNTVNPTNVLIDNKSQVKEAGPSKTPNEEVMDLGKNKKEDIVSKTNESMAKTIQDNIASKNSVFAPKMNQMSKSNSEKKLEISDSVSDKNCTHSVSSKDDGKSISNKDSNITLVESSESLTCTLDPEMEKSKGNEQKVEVQPDKKIQASTLIKEKTKPNVTMTHKESPVVINDVSSNLTSYEQTQTLQTNEVQNKLKAIDKEWIEKTKTLAVSNIPTATKLITTYKQVKDIDKKEAEELKESKKKTALDTEKCHQHAKTTESFTAAKADKLNLVAESNPTKLAVEKETDKPKATIQTNKIDQMENKIQRIEKINPVLPVETKADSQSEKQNLIAKPIEKTSLETESNPVSKVESNAALAETKALEKKVEPKAVSHTSKFISVAKGVEPKPLPKAALVNPTEKKIETVESSKTIKISDVKTNEPKTFLKTEKANQLPTTEEAKAALKQDLIIPATKALELKTLPKTVLLNPIPKGIELKTSNVVKGVSVTQQNPRSSAVIITSNKIYDPTKVDSLTNVEIKLPDASTNTDQKPINNNHTAVPFGKWTDANRQEFLNKFKEIKVPATSSSKQIKNSNDLNRIDVLKKIDSQRSNTASAKTQDKSNTKDTVFSSKIAQPKVETKIPVKNEGLKMKVKPIDTKSSPKCEEASETVSSTATSNVDTSDVAAKEPEERREVNVNDLIGRAIVDMLNRPVPMPMTRSPLDEPRHVDNKDTHTHVSQSEANTDSQNLVIDQQKLINDQQKLSTDQHKIKIDQQKPNTDQQKIKLDQQKLNTDQQKIKIDQQKLNVDQQKLKTDKRKLNSDQQKLNIEQKIDEDSSGSLDDIEMKMNELHGIPFVERPPHELPRVHKTYGKSSKDKQNKGAKKLLPATSKQTTTHASVIDLESDEEVIEHEPITGDIDISKNLPPQISVPTAAHASEGKESQKKDPVITENDFDKFARRNSITYENCLTVKFDGKPGNVVQTVKEKDSIKTYPKNETSRLEDMTILPHKQIFSQSHDRKTFNTKLGGALEDPNSKNYQSKIHTAYHSVLTAKRQIDRPITIIEDKPVKVVFMDANAEFVPNQLDFQGKELSPAKKPESTKVSPQAFSSNVTDVIEDKQQDDVKAKTKHQRKQVLTPVEAPELELIQPRDLGLDVSPKKKRKTDDNKPEKSLKNVVHKKSYLLGRAATMDKNDIKEIPVKETINHTETVAERTVSAIDSLVKAAELLDNQSVHSASPNPDSQRNTPVKRGRGRPRKYPLQEEAASHIKVDSPSPQKKPRLIDAKPVKRDPLSDEESSDDEQMIRENWTMGKINENIVCPICNKLFRSENVVFKHVKHCTGVSPTRSELEKRSPRRRRYSRESDNKSFDSQSDEMEFDQNPKESVKNTPKKLKSKEEVGIPDDEVEVIVIEDTPVKEQGTGKESLITRDAKEKSKHVQEPANETTDEAQDKSQKLAQEKPQKFVEDKPVKEKTLKDIADEKLAKAKKLEELPTEKTAKAKKFIKTSVQRSSNLVCEFCGKTFRQLSYLVSHKQQHKKEQLKKLEAKLTTKLQVFTCEVCNKEFKKMHHLVQHKIIHNPEVPTRITRKSSSEQSDTKIKEQPASKQNDDTSAGFRCEPCDKSFRKLHHLVEHRETHDGINRQKTNAQTVAPTIEKPPPPPQCDVCKKSFRKLHHLIEHKEQHLIVEQVETSSEKSDDKSVQSSLSTRDIIHECSLCYMVFPNEHSLNKHFVFCQQKKKRQSKAKDKPENVDGVDVVESTKTEESMDVEDNPKIVAEQIIGDDKVEIEQENKTAAPEKIEEKRVSEKPTDTVKIFETAPGLADTEIPVPNEKAVTELKSKPDLPILADRPNEKKVISTPENTKKVDVQKMKVLPKKTPVKDKVAPSVTRRQKSLAPLPILLESKPVETSDDDEVKYMLNPNFKADETSEGKVFMKVRSNKRNSLQIERPNSKDLMSRRTSLQHPPKIPRLKAKAVEPKLVPTVTKNVPKPPKLEAASTDSDDSDVKYSFPATVTVEAPKTEETPKGKVPRKSLAEKRKSLAGIAKRKSVGQAIAKLKANPSPVRIIKRRTLGVEHRCDCGQLFNSAALLTRHTSLAHTPPRIRRRRSPPPEPSANTTRKPAAEPPTKPSARSEAPIYRSTRKSSVKSVTAETRKSIKQEQSQEKKSSTKPKRTGAAHSGVPVPEKMRKMMMKIVK